ncbi:MAG: hypothetical protein ACR2FH_00890, partial [Caulobacteraceae bacterium]
RGGLAMTGRTGRRRPGPLLAPSREGLRSLVAVAGLSFAICVVGIFACAIVRAAPASSARLVGSATVVVRGSGLESPEAAAARAAEVLGAAPGVARAWPLDANPADGIIARLIDGKSPSEGDARLVAVTFDPADPPTAQRLSRLLAAHELPATADDHRPGSSRVWRAAVLAALTAAGLLVLASTGVAIAAFRQVHQRLVAQGELVDLLRLVGAADAFVSGLFVARTARWLAWAAAAGALAAALATGFWRQPGSMQTADIPFTIHWADLAAAAAWPFMVASSGALAAWIAARRILRAAP